MNDKVIRINRLIVLFSQFLNLLRKYKGDNHIYGIEGILGILTDKNCPVETRLEETRLDYKTMMGGAGTLGDFMISHSNQKTENKLNEELNEIEDELWNLLDLNLSHLPSVDEGYSPGHPYWSIKDPK